MEISGNELFALPRGLKPVDIKLDGNVRRISRNEEYHAIVYEYLPDSGSAMDVEVIQAQLDLFWLAGFCMVPVRKENWKGSGVLLDMADLICPWHVGWYPDMYKRRPAEDIVREHSRGTLANAPV